MTDLFTSSKMAEKKNINSYDEESIVVLEGLEPVRKMTEMYIGSRDATGLHHLVTEIFDNAMDEAVAGYANYIELSLSADGYVTVKDNGRGIPVGPHPKSPDKSTLEVILTTLHAGGKFNNKVYETSGGLHGVGTSVVNALSDSFIVEVRRDKKIWRQAYSKGIPLGKVEEIGAAKDSEHGTKVTFHPDEEIFGNSYFSPKKLYELAKSKAYLYRGVRIKWSCDPVLVDDNGEVPVEQEFHFPGGLADFLSTKLNPDVVVKEIFSGKLESADNIKLEWAISWEDNDNPILFTYCNTIYTPLGGTHEIGMRNALTRSIKDYAEQIGNKKYNIISSDDIMNSTIALLSLFISKPQFQGQTKEKLVNQEVAKIVENLLKDHFDHFLANNKNDAEALLNLFIKKAEERINRKSVKDNNKKAAAQKIPLAGKLVPATKSIGAELYIVEGDSAGGSAKQARNRETQAILPLKGKILNVANSTIDKIRANQELNDLEIALACGTGKNYNHDNLRYDKVIIMTDADVDGAHIASLLMTYFICQMPELVKRGNLYLAKPPLYRIVQGAKTFYAGSDKEKDKIVSKLSSSSKTHIEIGRFKGLGEMTASQLKETTMDPEKRTLIQVTLPDNMDEIFSYVDNLMGKKAEYRYEFIQQKALILEQELISSLDI